MDILDNITWHALSGPHSRFASGAGGARRYASGFSPILGFADPSDPDFESIAPHCRADEHFYTDGWTGAAPNGWVIEMESTMYKMVWEGMPPSVDESPAARLLGPADAEQAFALAMLTRPGPFGPRTIELGDYLGVFEGPRLVAMAGERMFAATMREISGVCTHPDFQGRGLARRLVAALIRRQVQRGETPFLHVMSANVHARALYRRMGFGVYKESVVRVVAPDS